MHLKASLRQHQIYLRIHEGNSSGQERTHVVAVLNVKGVWQKKEEKLVNYGPLTLNYAL